jgi:D-alanyl-D-alanine carboxypeptidase
MTLRNLARFLFLTGCLFLSGQHSIHAEGYKTSGVAIYDIKEGRFLFRQRSKTQRAPASTIKVVTALTAWNYAKGKWNDWITVSAHAASAQPTKAYIKAGEKYKLKDLVAMTLVASCNDAARAVAEAVSGSEASFARDMKKIALSLGATSTHTTNASGLPLPKGMVTTPTDSILFILALRKNPTLKKMIAQRSATLVSSAGRRITKANHNRLLKEGFAYPVLGKTGFTNLARHCFLSWCDHGDRSIAISMLGAPNSSQLWSDLRSAYRRHMKSRAPYLPNFMKKNGISIGSLHSKLKSKGFPVSGESSYGSKTRQAVTAFQRAKRLSVDGIVGPQTWAALR